MGLEPKTENASLMVHLYLRLVPAPPYHFSISDLEEYLKAEMSVQSVQSDTVWPGAGDMKSVDSIIHLNMEIGKQFIILIAKLLTADDFDKDNRESRTFLF